jgi:diguanylate cyclase (GGDEF)-like protein
MAAAQVLKSAFRMSDIVARIGGDEFVVLAVDAGESWMRFCSCKHWLTNSMVVNAVVILSAGIGAVRCSPNELKPLGELLASADAAMYANKQRRRQQALHCVGCAIHVPPRP